jgi:hypothetical protein
MNTKTTACLVLLASVMFFVRTEGPGLPARCVLNLLPLVVGFVVSKTLLPPDEPSGTERERGRSWAKSDGLALLGAAVSFAFFAALFTAILLEDQEMIFTVLAFGNSAVAFMLFLGSLTKKPSEEQSPTPA